MSDEIKTGKLFIGNEWRDATGGATLDVVNPATEEVLTTVPSATEEDLDAAVAAARGALDGAWGKMSARARGQLLWKIGEALNERVEEVARLETLHNGKPIFESRYVDIPMCAEIFQYYAGWADKMTGSTIPSKGATFNFTLREPLGVIGAIVPFNFPLLLATWKIAPALACGNAIVVKPATQTPLTMLALAEICESVGLPPGALNVITGRGSSIGAAIVKHPGIDKVAFTGSTENGREIIRHSADNITKVSLELGGKSPNIVFDDADVDAAVRGAATGIFYGKGEVCAAGSRLLVHSGVKDQLMEKLTARAGKVKPGDPMHPKTKLGAISSKGQMESVLDYIEKGKADGAEVVAGGKRADIGTGKGYFIEATVFDGVKHDHRISQEEIFGPVLATVAFDDEDEAIAYANGTQFGLAAGIWTNNVKRAHRVAARLRAGTVWVNTYNNYDTAMPFGGYKKSGYGRELGAEALEQYTQVKSVIMDLG